MLTGLLLALLAGGAVAAGWRLCAGYPPPRPRHRWLTRAECALLDAAAEATFPRGGAIPASGLDAELPSYFERVLEVSHPRTRALMRCLLLLFEHATLVFPAPGRRGRRRFSRLSLAQRAAVLDDWSESRLFARRLVFVSLRSILTMGYFAHPPVLRALRIAPFAIDPPLREADLLYPRIGTLPATIPWTPADLSAPGDAEPLRPDSPLDPAYAGDAA